MAGEYPRLIVWGDEVGPAVPSKKEAVIEGKLVALVRRQVDAHSMACGREVL